MEKDVQSFLDSNLLHKYLIGATTDKENIEVDYFMLKYPEVQRAYKTLEDNLEIKAKFDAVNAPEHILDAVIDTIDTDEDTKPVIKMATSKTIPWYSIAASITAIMFAITSFLLFKNNIELQTENNIIAEEIFDLRNDIDQNNKHLTKISTQLAKLNNPDARRYVISGNALAEDLKTVAYINPIEKTTMIDVVSLPEISEDQYYQIRAELQDRMVNLGILDDSKRQLKPIPYLEDALALSITLETKNDSIPNNTLEVAQIALQ